MTTGPTDVKVTTAAGGPDGMPLALRLSEGLGPNALKPCAHCGHMTAPKMTSAAELNCDDEDEFSSWPHSDSFAVICDAARPGGAGGCGAMGGFMPTEAEAASRWNTRIAPARGWRFERDDMNRIIVVGPDGSGCVVDNVANDARMIPEEVLFALAVALGA